MSETYHEIHSRLSEGWHLLQRSIDDDLFFIAQHRRFGRDDLLALRLGTYLSHVRSLSRIEEEMEFVGIGFPNMTEIRHAARGKAWEAFL